MKVDHNEYMYIFIYLIICNFSLQDGSFLTKYININLSFLYNTNYKVVLESAATSRKGKKVKLQKLHSLFSTVHEDQ